MPPKLSLRGFLRQDLLLSRTKSLIPYYHEHNASRKPNTKGAPAASVPFPPRPASPPNEDVKGDAEPTQDVDSVFGEPIFTKEEILQQKVEQLLAEDNKSKPDTKQQCQNPELGKLKGELSSLVLRELEASREERQLIRNRKTHLITAIGKLEARIQLERVHGCKGKSVVYLNGIKRKRNTDISHSQIRGRSDIARAHESSREEASSNDER
jgi:hypothetical protein